MAVLLARGTLLYLAGVNTASAGVFAYDKLQAARKGWRVSEKRLCQTALVGGWLGGLTAMHMLHHKTRKLSFQAKYVDAITANAAISLPALLAACAFPPFRVAFLDALRGYRPRKPPRKPPRFRR